MKTLALALALMAAPALADSSLPPARFDVGGETEADTIVNYVDRLGQYAAPLVRVPIDQVQAECDKANLERLGVPYPAVAGQTLVGCLVRRADTFDPIIVYGYDNNRPWIANQFLRHEIGHLLGWSGRHER